MKEFLLKKIEKKDIKVGVIGLGYVGLPLAVEKAKAGFVTKGFDVQAQKVDMVNAGVNYIGDVVDNDLKELAELRVENPEMSLRELGEALREPITRSGVNHRLKRLSRMAQDLRGEG